MASISSAGLGSGLDVAGLVQKLVDAERAPADTRLTKAESTTRTQLSAFASLRGSLSNLKTALAKLQKNGAFDARGAKSSDDTVFTATAQGTAVPGQYAVEVQSLASAHKLSSNAFPTSTSLVGTGRLDIAVGSKSFHVDLDAITGTSAGIVDAINKASDNPGVTASLVTANDGVHLVLTAKDTGAGNALRVTRSGGDGGLDALVYNPGTLANLTEVTPAANASIRVDSHLYSSASNQVTGMIDSLTLNLVTAKPGTTLQLTVTRDTATARKAVESFVNAHNAVASTIANLTRYDASTKTASALTGDSLARSAAGQLRSALSQSVPDLDPAFNALSDIGITTQTDGTLKIDGSKLDAALSGNFDAVAKLFSTGPNGIADSFISVVDRFIGSKGAIGSRTDSLNKQLTDIASQRTALDRRMSDLEARYRAQFTALDSLVSKMQATSSFLTQQLSSSSS